MDPGVQGIIGVGAQPEGKAVAMSRAEVVLRVVQIGPGGNEDQVGVQILSLFVIQHGPDEQEYISQQ